MTGESKDDAGQNKDAASNFCRSVTDMEAVRPAEIIDFIPDAILAIDLSGIVIAWNRAMEELTGIKAVDILGKGNYEYALPLYRTRRPTLADLALKPDANIEAEYTNLKRDGMSIRARYISSLAGTHLGKRPLYDSSGNVIGAIESIRDITERKGWRKISREEKYYNLRELHTGLYQSVGR
jgi:PAS domain S-box-containing protein